MKKQSFISTLVITLTATFVLLTSNVVFAADVASLINRGSSQNELGEEISIAEANCTSAAAQPRIIVSKVGERNWCSQDIPDVCSRTKLGAAKKVCHFTFSAQLEESQNGGNQTVTSTEVVLPIEESEVSDTPAPSLQEQAELNEVQIEKDQISIEQQKLQIRRQELELNKRRLELERQAVSTD